MRGELIEDVEELKEAIMRKVERVAEEIDDLGIGIKVYGKHVRCVDDYFFDSYPFDDNGFPSRDMVRYWFGGFKDLREESDVLCDESSHDPTKLEELKED